MNLFASALELVQT